jgi:hypothetical protein
VPFSITPAVTYALSNKATVGAEFSFIFDAVNSYAKKYADATTPDDLKGLVSTAGSYLKDYNEGIDSKAGTYRSTDSDGKAIDRGFGVTITPSFTYNFTETAKVIIYDKIGFSGGNMANTLGLNYLFSV